MRNLFIAGTAMLALTACGGGGGEDKSASDKIADISKSIATSQDSENLAQAEAALDEIMTEASETANETIREANKVKNDIFAIRSKPTIAAGAAFLAENATADGVITTDSGLQYKVVQAGLENGAQAEVGQEIAAHYHGYFIEGEVFDSSYRRGKPLIGPSNGFIKGWNESLGDMKVCEARTLYINSDLAYGPLGRGSIPGGATLLFNMQLIAVKGAGEKIYECPEDKVLSGPEAYK